MYKLEGGTHFLVLSESIEEHDQDLTVSCHRSFNDALNKIQDGARLSPIFPLNKAPVPDFKNHTKSKLFFFGPIFPGKLGFSAEISVFLTLGTLNVVAWAKNQASSDELEAFLEGESLPYEIWELENNKIIEPTTISIPPSADIPNELRHTLHSDDELKVAAREYSLLMCRAYATANRYWHGQAEDFKQFDQGLRNIQEGEKDNLGRLTNLVITNAALSRFLSQAYAGTPPIIQNECSYITNSLLGIGLANQVLISIQKFASKTFYEARIIQRLRYLKSCPTHDKKLISVPLSSDYFEKNHLHSDQIEALLKETTVHPPVPNITCFSGRDGFKSTKFSLSAPLEVISNANTYEWTLMTLTHEISHITIDGVMGLFFPNPKDPSHLERFLGYIRTDADSVKPVNLYEQVEQLLVFGFHLIDKERKKIKNDSSTKIQLSQLDVSRFIIEGSPEVDELLTHIFDFRYFYKGDVNLYVKSIWSSWAVVPNIENRIKQYLIRTLCALISISTDWPLAHSITTLRNELDSLLSEKGQDENKTIINLALKELKANETEYVKCINNRLPFIKFANAFLYSPIISKALISQGAPAAGVLSFRHNQISNPLWFLEEHAIDHRQNMLKSVWMLQHLAFCDENSFS